MSILTRTALSLLIASPLLALTIASCGSEVSRTGASSAQSSGAGASSGSGGGGGNGSGSGSGGGSGGSGGSGGGGGPAIAYCSNQVYACGNGIDDDGDGMIDAQDAHCLGPCDNNEGDFYGGIPGSDGPACLMDCYFDSNSGSGNDGCYWNHACDPLSVAPNHYPEWWNGAKCAYNENALTPGTSHTCDELRNGQSQNCLGVCPHLTPNGCDCFGCCELPAGSGKFVWLGSEDGGGNGTCRLEDLGDPKKCASCTPVQGACHNACAPCELCIGKTKLPPECSTDPGNTEQCAPDLQPCGLPGQDPCPAGTYCITGCCQPTPK